MEALSSWPTLYNTDRSTKFEIHHTTTQDWGGLSKRVQKLIGFDFEIQPGTAKRVASALSRKDEGELEFGAVEVPCGPLKGSTRMYF